jgi:hypothetical protein
MSVIEYLEAERKAVEESQSLWQAEFTLFCTLADLYEQLLTVVKVDCQRIALPAELFLATLNQMYGVASQMLRKRIGDAHELTRRAIELTSTAYRLWQHPELSPVYLQAYPNLSTTGHPKQWQPSAIYKQEFSTGRLLINQEKHGRGSRSIMQSIA